MEVYQAVLILIAVGAVFLLRSLFKPVAPSVRSSVTIVKSNTDKYVPQQKDSSRRLSSSRSINEDDDFGTSLAIGIATGAPIGPNLSAGLLGVMMHESSKISTPAESQPSDDRHDNGSSHSHSSRGESSSHSYGGSDGGGSSSYGGTESSSSSSSDGGGSD